MNNDDDFLITDNWSTMNYPNTTEGLELARKYGIGAVPTLIIVDEAGEMQDSASGIDKIEALLEE